MGGGGEGWCVEWNTVVMGKKLWCEKKFNGGI